MKIQFHSLITKGDIAPNIGIAYMHKYRTVAFGVLIFSITITFGLEKENEK